jgi:hypothetical protein
MTMTLIETKTLASAAASIEFTSIPQTFTDLVVLVSGRTTRTDDFLDALIFRFNGDTNAANYSSRRLLGDGSGVGSDTAFSQLALTSATATADTFGNQALYIANYTGATNKSVSSDGVSENNAVGAGQSLNASLWSNTSAITQITFTSGTSSNFVAGSTISLYGILKGSDGIVTTS